MIVEVHEKFDSPIFFVVFKNKFISLFPSASSPLYPFGDIA
jgi:hypothetical protein